MANQWFLQHGGKQYGPLTSAQLKKLAGEGKIKPDSQVRLGAEGNWAPAARVQGLFPPTSSIDSLPPIVPVAAPASTVRAQAIPPQAVPMAPPMASPLARATIGVGSPIGKAARVEKPALAGKLVGSIGLIFGILALATFWLPMLDRMMGWTGIVVGAIGLLLGIAGIVVAAVQGGSALYLNVATASSSLVGLVLTVVLGITTGMFSRPAAPFVEVPLQVVQQPAPAPQPIEPEPESAPPPEPVWTDAGEAIEQGPIRARVSSVTIEQVRLESLDLAQMKRSKPQPMLRVRVSIENLSADKIATVPGWNAAAGALPSGVGDLLKGSELGSQLESATATARLTDQAGNSFLQTPAIRLSTAQADLGASPSVRPGESVEKDLLFDPPLETSEYLRLELPAAGFGGSESLRFQIPRAMFSGM
jgi:hypothetical protein